MASPLRPRRRPRSRVTSIRARDRRLFRVSNAADPDSDLCATGALLPGPDATLAGPTVDEWLDSTS